MLGVWKGVTPASLFTPLVRWKSNILVDFGVNFLTGGTPGAARAPSGDQDRSQVDFVMVFDVPEGVLEGG